MNKAQATITGLFLVAASMTNAEVWTPQIKFQLEDGDFPSTVLWISGFGYAVNAVGNGKAGSTSKLPFCTPENQYIGSRELLKILNDKFEGQTITSEQATEEIMKQLPRQYPC